LPVGDPQLNAYPEVNVGMLIRSRPTSVFQALIDPEITTQFWFTKSTGKVAKGAELTWTWEMYGVSSTVNVQEVDENERIRFTWSGYTPERPTTVEFRLTARKDETTYLVVTETGFTGDGDTLVQHATDSSSGFAFFLSALKALLEHDIILRVVLDAHPPECAA
jgi:uncharacterized protein YndB with AHSA1/START domain